MIYAAASALPKSANEKIQDMIRLTRVFVDLDGGRSTKITAFIRAGGKVNQNVDGFLGQSMPVKFKCSYSVKRYTPLTCC